MVLKKVLSLTCAVFLLLMPVQSVMAQSKSDVQVYIARDESPRQVLSYLLGLFGRDLAGSSNMISRPVSGKFEVRSVKEVMSYFERAYNLNWFEYGLSIYVYRPSDWRSEKFYVGEYDSSTDWKELLANAGLENSKFNVLYSNQKQELIVSGPESYIRLLKRTFEQTKPETKEENVLVMDEGTGQMVEKSKKDLKPEFMIFPLKYTSVTDRKIKLRDEEMTMPGVFTVLSSILAGGGTLGAPSGGASEQDPYGLQGLQLSALAHPKTAVEAASQLVKKSVRGDEPDASMFPNGIPKLGSKRDPNDPNSSIDIPAASAVASESGRVSGSIYADTRTNSLIVYDTTDKYPYYKSILDKLDVPISMIEVEALLVELDSSTLNQLGVEFGVNQGSVRYDFPATDSLQNPSPIFRGGGNESLLGASSVVDPQKFVARIRALASDRRAKVLARPTIVTQDNVTAFIDLSETLYLQIQGERVAQVEKVTAGSLLQVTPRLLRNDDGQDEIFIRVEIQDGALQESNASGNPSVRNTSLSTQALIGQDKAILIGGYNRESQSEIDHKIPVLGSLPVIGKVFSSKETTTQNTARLFLIIPKVLSKPAYFAKSTRDAVDKVKRNFDYDSTAVEVPPSVKLYRMDTNLTVE